MSEAMTAQCSPPPSEPAKRRILSVQRNRPDRALDHVAVDLDATVVEKAGQSRPARQRIADRFGELGLLTDQVELGAQPWLKRIEDWPALGLAQGAALVGTAAARLGLDGIELGNPLQGFARDRRGTGDRKLVEATAHV